MGFGKVVLVVSGLGFLIFGIGFLLWPVAMGELVHLDLDHPVARTDVRALYGGLEIGIGLFLIACVFREWMVFPGLIAGVFCFGSLAFGRLVGIVIDQSAEATMLTALLIEISGAVLGVVALTRVRPAD